MLPSIITDRIKNNANKSNRINEEKQLEKTKENFLVAFCRRRNTIG